MRESVRKKHERDWEWRRETEEDSEVERKEREK